MITRRDRSLKAKRGGVALYAKTELNCTVTLESSKVAELSWAVVHTNIGPILCGIWYRAKNDKEAITAFEEDVSTPVTSAAKKNLFSVNENDTLLDETKSDTFYSVT